MADQAPIIIKRIKKGGHGGHHGGAWKVAYADFVTAMMAFFLLLWLLNVTTPEQRKGIADYFTPTIGLKDSKGIGFKGGKSPSEIGISKSDLTTPGPVAGQVQAQPVTTAPTTDVSNPNATSDSSSAANDTRHGKQEDKQDSDQFKLTAQDINQSLEQDPDIKDYKNDVVVQESPEGLKIDIIDDEKKPMFVPGSAQITDLGKKVLDSMASIIVKSPNNISINGHTDASGATLNPQYTNWELSADRANAARRFLMTTQLEPDRVQKVVGYADRDLLTPQEPTSPRNRRITIILLRGSYFRDPKETPTTRALLSVPDAKVKQPAPPKPPPTSMNIKPAGMFDPNAKPAGR
ncbi:MAG: flagellar motor protein MotB [Pseudomonadota bacterium]|nr:flagellar motor protein MotB [Pseudomonadota bacterium]